MTDPILYGLRNIVTKEVLVLAYRRRETADAAAARKSNRWGSYEVVPLHSDTDALRDAIWSLLDADRKHKANTGGYGNKKPPPHGHPLTLALQAAVTNLFAILGERQ